MGDVGSGFEFSYPIPIFTSKSSTRGLRGPISEMFGSKINIRQRNLSIRETSWVHRLHFQHHKLDLTRLAARSRWMGHHHRGTPSSKVALLGVSLRVSLYGPMS
jgi:hypothetical protein